MRFVADFARARPGIHLISRLEISLHGQTMFMNTKNLSLSLFLSRLGDIGLLSMGAWFQFLATDGQNFSTIVSGSVRVRDAALCGALLLCWHLSIASQGFYSGAQRRLLKPALIASGMASAGLFIVARIGEWAAVDVGEAARFGLCALVMLVGVRLGARALGRRLLGAEQIKSVLIVGGGPRAQSFAESIAGQPEMGFRLLGYVESDPEFNFYDIGGRPCLGGLEDLPHLVATMVVDEVVIALPVKSMYAEIQKAVACLEEQGVTAHLLTDFFPVQLARCEAIEMHGQPVVSLQSAPQTDWRAEIKLAIDVALALIALIVLLPLFAVVALAIRLDSKGPVFFVQQRMGHRKRPFRLYKFRTMVADAEARMAEVEHLNEKDGPVFKARRDPRVTRLGRWLRRTSIDELPQLINVILGDMSLVGPRPLSMRDALGLGEAWQKRRFSVKPGITGLWQISGRSDLSFERWMRLDLEYIDKWSLMLDLQILLRTVPAVLTARGAV